jgi:hypothetical protein
LPEALPVLLQAFEDPKQHDVVKCAALVGIDRHARSGGAEALKPRITGAMLALLGEKKPPADRSTEGHDWMRGQAADILGTLRGIGAKNEVVTALEQVLADSTATPSLRVRAARALGNLDYSAAKQLNPSELAARLADFAVSSYNQEKAQKDRVGQYPNRRLLKVFFQSTYAGLVGAGGPDNKQNLLALAKTAGEPHTGFVTGLVGELAPVTNHEIFDTEAMKEVDLNKQFIDLRSKASKLESFLKANRPKTPAKAAAAAPAPAEAGKQAPPPAAGPPPAAAPSPAPAAPPAGKR